MGSPGSPPSRSEPSAPLDLFIFKLFIFKEMSTISCCPPPQQGPQSCPGKPCLSSGLRSSFLAGPALSWASPALSWADPTLPQQAPPSVPVPVLSGRKTEHSLQGPELMAWEAPWQGLGLGPQEAVFPDPPNRGSASNIPESSGCVCSTSTSLTLLPSTCHCLPALQLTDQCPSHPAGHMRA